MPPERIRVVPNGVHPDTRPPGPREPIILSVGHPRAAQADRRAGGGARPLLRRARRPTRRPAGWSWSAARAGTRSASGRPRARAARSAASCAREELLDLYRRATLLAYPSAYEGFGLPVVEAMAHGLPGALRPQLVAHRDRRAVGDLPRRGHARRGSPTALADGPRRPRGAAPRAARRAARRPRATRGRRRPRPPGTSTGRPSADERRPARAGLGAAGRPQLPARAGVAGARAARARAGRIRARASTACWSRSSPGATTSWRAWRGSPSPATASTCRARSCCASLLAPRGRGALGGGRPARGRDRALAGARPGARPAGGGRARAALRGRVVRRGRVRLGDRARGGRRRRARDGGDAGGCCGRAGCCT